VRGGQRDVEDIDRAAPEEVRQLGPQRRADHLHEHVDAEQPRQLARGQPELGLDRRHRRPDDGDVERPHEHAHEEHPEHPIALLVVHVVLHLPTGR